MKRIVVALAVVSLSACNFSPLPSNDPDSGVSCIASPTPVGSGTSNLFSVGSAYERAGQYSNPDSGAVTGARIDLTLFNHAIPCSDRDGGGGGDSFLAILQTSGASRIQPGTFFAKTPDGGSNNSLVGIGTFDGGARIVSDGTVTLTSVQSCSVTGTFDVRFPIPDGGFDPFNGTFSSEFCSL
ncbi:MAG: hypothetical protein JNM17_15980 [Archangium sp.]|nr:hypothetical protein [Archangium sp.]